jgi:uncharacterized protein DUF5047
MLERGDDPMYREALATSHQAYVKVEVLSGSQEVLEADLVFQTGSVAATLTSRVSRTCTLTVPEDLYPFMPDDLLAPYGNMIRATRGIEFADGSRFAWVVFIGRIQEATLNGDGACTVEASDFAADVLENRFVRPENSQPSSSITQEVTRLISEGFPAARFGPMETFEEPVRARTWQLERGQALDEITTSAGAFWYPRADGRFVLRRYPWTVPGAPVVTYSDTGKLGSVGVVRAARSRAGVYNSLTVTGERLNGDAPVYALAQDTNAASTTYIDGGFGQRHQMLRLQTPGSVGAAQGAANENLKRLIGLYDVWGWEMTPDASLELGDVAQLDVVGRKGIIQVVAAYRMPLDLSGAMQVAGRSQIADILEGVV